MMIMYQCNKCLMKITFKLIGHIQGLDEWSSLGFKMALTPNITRCDSIKRSKKLSLYASKLTLGTNMDNKELKIQPN